MEKKDIVKFLVNKKLLHESVRYDVSCGISFSPDEVKDELEKLQISEDELMDLIQEYTKPRKIFFFAKLLKPWDKLKFKINNEIQKPNYNN